MSSGLWQYMSIERLLISERQFALGDPKRVRFVVRNTGAESVRFLRRDTPLDDGWTDCFRVWCDGVAVAYDGPIVKRAVPTDADYLVLDPDAEIERECDLNEAYQISLLGPYSVEVAPQVRSLAPQES